MSTETESSKGRTRSPAYPVISLGPAIESARKLWDSQRKQESHIDSALKALGYARHGASLRIVAALGHYGLTEESGSGDERKIRLSELAQDLVHLLDTDPKRRQALKNAALNPAIHQVLWERYGAHLPDDGAIRPFLIRDKGYNDSIVEDVINNYRETFALANLGKIEDHDGDEQQTGPKDNSRDFPARHNAALQKFANPGRQPQNSMNADVQELPILVGPNLVARIPFPMTADDFDLLIGTLNLWKRKLVDFGTPPKKPVTRTFPVKAIWHNKDHDIPVIVAGIMGEKDGQTYYTSGTGTGIPGSELKFEG